MQATNHQLSGFDKAYHTLCLLPTVKTVIGGLSALWNGLWLIRDLAMMAIFRDWPQGINPIIDSFLEVSVKMRDHNKKASEASRKINVMATAHGAQNFNEFLETEKQISKAEELHNYSVIYIFLLSDVNPVKRLDGLSRGLISAVPFMGTAYSLYQLVRYW